MDFHLFHATQSPTLETIKGVKTLVVPSDILGALAQESLRDVRLYFAKEQLAGWKSIIESPRSSGSEKALCHQHILAAVEAAQKGVPYCQDTGTDSVYLFRGAQTVLGGDDVQQVITRAATDVRSKNPFRSSVFTPLLDYQERNTGDNSPPEIHMFSRSDPHTITGIFSAKGGGSGSKLWSFSEKPLLSSDRNRVLDFLIQKIAQLGHAACPPYHLSIILGGLSHLDNSQLLTRSTLGDETIEDLPGIIRDKSLEAAIAQTLAKSNLGAQGEGKYFVFDEGIRVYRAPRHAAHFFIGIGVSCSAHRVQHFRITAEGVFLQTLEKNPTNYLPDTPVSASQGATPHVSLQQNRESILKDLRKLKAGENFTVSGYLLGARDKAHARWLMMHEQGEKMPAYLSQYIGVMYVGPADTPEGDIIGSFGPTTAGRMDDFAPFLLENDFLPLSIGKGNRSQAFAQTCGQYKGMFAALPGGPAADLRRYVRSVEVIDYEELGMEAVRLYRVEELPMRMIVDSRGQDFYAALAEEFVDGGRS